MEMPPSVAVEGVDVECPQQPLLALRKLETGGWAMTPASQANRRRHFFALLGAGGSSPPPWPWQGSLPGQSSVPWSGYEGAQTRAGAPPFSIFKF